MDMDGNVVRGPLVRVLGKDDGNVFGVLQQATTTRLDLICVLGRLLLCDTGTITAHAMIIDLAGGRACAVGKNTPLEYSSFGRAALYAAFKTICLDQTLARRQICYVATIMHGGAEPLTWSKHRRRLFLSAGTMKNGQQSTALSTSCLMHVRIRARDT
jgi:hypothetical protein